MSGVEHEIDMRGQVALVTGGGRGLGRAYAQALARAGAAVAVAARSENEPQETVRLIEGAGGRAIAIPLDVTDRAEVERAVAEVEGRLGPIDLLVNNAGVMSPMGPDWEVDPDRWWRTIEVNLLGPFLCARTVLVGMVARHRGRIVNISSGAAYLVRPHSTAYAASKAALTRLTECLAEAAREHGVSVLAYAPGFVRSAMTEYLAESPEVSRWSGDQYRRLFEEGRDTPIERAVEVFLFLASGRADVLSGCHLGVGDDVADLVRRAEEVRRNSLYVMRLRR